MTVPTQIATSRVCACRPFPLQQLVIFSPRVCMRAALKPVGDGLHAGMGGSMSGKYGMGCHVRTTGQDVPSRPLLTGMHRVAPQACAPAASLPTAMLAGTACRRSPSPRDSGCSTSLSSSMCWNSQGRAVPIAPAASGQCCCCRGAAAATCDDFRFFMLIVHFAQQTPGLGGL